MTVLLPYKQVLLLAYKKMTCVRPVGNAFFVLNQPVLKLLGLCKAQAVNTLFSVLQNLLQLKKMALKIYQV